MAYVVSPARRIRVFLSICAAAAGSLICQVQHHFTLSLADPHSFILMTQHRCGRTLLAGLIWMTCETALTWIAASRSVATSPERGLGFSPDVQDNRHAGL